MGCHGYITDVRIGSGTTRLTDVTANGDTILIDSSDLTLAMITSRLTVTEVTAGDYRYRCQVNISDLGITETEDVHPLKVSGMLLFPQYVHHIKA